MIVTLLFIKVSQIQTTLLVNAQYLPQGGGTDNLEKLAA